jgi:hypothetical protein
MARLCLIRGSEGMERQQEWKRLNQSLFRIETFLEENALGREYTK